MPAAIVEKPGKDSMSFRMENFVLPASPLTEQSLFLESKERSWPIPFPPLVRHTLNRATSSPQRKMKPQIFRCALVRVDRCPFLVIPSAYPDFLLRSSHRCHVCGSPQREPHVVVRSRNGIITSNRIRSGNLSRASCSAVIPSFALITS